MSRDKLCRFGVVVSRDHCLFVIVVLKSEFGVNYEPISLCVPQVYFKVVGLTDEFLVYINLPSILKNFVLIWRNESQLRDFGSLKSCE
jgi:hypothetical protein